MKLSNQKGFTLVPLIVVGALMIFVGGYFLGKMYWFELLVYQFKEKINPTKSEFILSSPQPDPDQDFKTWRIFENKEFGFRFSYPGTWYPEYRSSKNVIDFTKYGGAVLKYDVSKELYGTRGEEDAEELIIGGRKAFKKGENFIIPLGNPTSAKLVLSFIGVGVTYKDQVLKTFEFTDQEKIEDLENWQTYQDTSNRFSFKYPSLVKVESLEDSGYKGVQLIYKEAFMETVLITNTAKSAGELADQAWVALSKEPGFKDTSQRGGIYGDFKGGKQMSSYSFVIDSTTKKDAAKVYFIQLDSNNVLRIIRRDLNDGGLTSKRNVPIVDEIFASFRFP